MRDFTLISQFEYRGWSCTILEVNWSGHLCGYLRIPKTHPLYHMSYSGDAFPELNVHGGITFSDKGYWEGCDEETWWIGFDCAHYGDLTPKAPGGVGRTGTYKDKHYVTKELQKLSHQLEKLKRIEIISYKWEVEK